MMYLDHCLIFCQGRITAWHLNQLHTLGILPRREGVRAMQRPDSRGGIQL